jgi:TonB family protein
MKRCPRCDKTYPDSETFCEADGTALVSAGAAFSESAGGGAGEVIECPVCGGKAQPGELICNFCGARLGAESPGSTYTPPPPSSTGASPRTARVSRDPSSSMRFTGKMPEGHEEKSGRGMLSVLGYVLAAVIALGGGAWLALHLSNKTAEQPVANASPAAPVVPAPTGPQVDLSKVMPVQVMGESASAPERNQEAVRKAFDDHKATLTETYSRALAGDGTLRDAMVVRIRVLPTGNVDAASVRTSTNANPGLDAEVVKDVSAWNFPPSSGPVEVDYPIIFTNDAASRDALESQLSAKLASLSPTEAPEFASAPPGSASTPAASVAESAPSPAIAPAPVVSAPPVAPVAVASEAAPAPVTEPPPAAVSRPRRRNLNRELASREPVTPPPLTLQQRVKQVLSGNPKLRRVDCYTSGSTVTIFGKVFDYQTKQYAERVVRGVSGVGNVIDSLATDESDWAARQAQIAQQLSNAGLNQVTVKVIGHDAYLGGTVKSDAEKNQAVTIAESASPIHVRGNLITVVPGNMFGF